MDQPMPRPPLLGRMTPNGWTVLMWGATLAVALLLFSMMAPTMTPVFIRPLQRVHIDGWGRAGIALLAALPVALTRRRPVLALSLILAEASVIAMLRQPTWPLLWITVALVAHLTVNRSRVAGATAAAATLLVWSVQWSFLTTGDRWDTLAVKPASAALPFVMAWSIGNSVHQRRRYAEALRTRAAAQAAVDERFRIARELHDTVAHSIGIIAIQAGAVNRVIGPETTPQVRETLQVIEKTSRETLAAVRHTLGMLRTADRTTPGQPRPPGLDGVTSVAQTAADAGVRVHVNWQGQRRTLPPDVDLSAFRIIQESVTNVVRHSGSDSCHVKVEFRDEELAIEVLDDGQDHRPTRSGYGIAGMRERVGLLGGHFEAGPRPEGGFRVEARLPV
ncbi:histidine kinase [Streptomyces sp. NPDC001833]|uniref:sensor histidine kinase n=1 Tax=Streptomyces sp. NPDC001833 TaxID=3154658 RepID=UPI003324B8C3